MSNYFTTTVRAPALMTFVLAITCISASASTANAVDPATLADLNAIGAKPTDSEKTVVEKARELQSVNFPDFTPRDLSADEYQAEFRRRGHVSDSIRKLLKRLKQKFRTGSLPESPDGTPRTKPRSGIDYSTYRHDSARFVEDVHARFEDPFSHRQGSPNPVPNFYDLENWMEQFGAFEQSNGDRGPNGQERVARLADNLRYMLSGLGEDFRQISRSSQSTYHVSGRNDHPTRWQLIYERTATVYKQLLDIDLSADFIQSHGRPDLSGQSSTSTIIRPSLLLRLMTMSQSTEALGAIASIYRSLVIGAGYVDLMQKSEMNADRYMNPRLQQLELERGLNLFTPILKAALTGASTEQRYSLLKALVADVSMLEAKSGIEFSWDHSERHLRVRRYIRELGFSSKKDFLALIVADAKAEALRPNPFITARRPMGQTLADVGVFLEIATAGDLFEELRREIGAETLLKLDPDKSYLRSPKSLRCEAIFQGSR